MYHKEVHVGFPVGLNHIGILKLNSKEPNPETSIEGWMAIDSQKTSTILSTLGGRPKKKLLAKHHNH